jgi:hypothetical protein
LLFIFLNHTVNTRLAVRINTAETIVKMATSGLKSETLSQDVPVDQRMDDEVVDPKQGTAADRADMSRMGKLQDLRVR